MKISLKIEPARSDAFTPAPLPENLILKEDFERELKRNVDEISMPGIPKQARRYKVEYEFNEIRIEYNNPKMNDGIRDAVLRTIDELPDMFKGL